MRGAPRAVARPVAKISKVSLVEVSPSMVTALKVSSTAGSSEARSACGSIAASVKRKASMVAMSGAIMPAPLAMPLMVTSTPSISALRVASLGKVSVVMMARAASAKASGLASRASVAKALGDLARIERLADHAGRGDIDVGLEAIGGFSRRLGGELHRLAPALAGEGIGIAGIDHERARHAVGEMRAAPIDRRRRRLRLGQHAGDRGAGIEQRKQQIDAAGIANAGGGGGDAHAVDRRQMRRMLRRERRDLAQSGL